MRKGKIRKIETNNLQKKVHRIIVGFFCVGSIGLLTACQSNASQSDSISDSGSADNLDLEEYVAEENSDSEISTDEYSYEELEDGTLKLTAYHPSEPLAEGGTLSVPEEIDGKKVTVIGEGCFSDEEAFDNKGWNSVIILPEGITTIENYIFNFEVWLKQIEIPDSVTEIKEAAFLRIADDGSKVPIATLIINCSKDSAAESYARNQGVKYAYTGEDWSEDEAFKEEFERQGVMGWTITGEGGEESFEYYGQYRMEGTYTDFCVVAYCNDWFGFVYDIVVLDKETGEELQRIPAIDMQSGSTFDTLISEDDADFDGEPEILLYRGVTGTQYAAFYFCYDWEEGLQSYVENESFRSIWNPVIDAEEQVVRGTSRGSATTHYYYTYAFIDGEFVEIEEVYSEFVDIEDVYSEFTSDKEEKVEILETYHFVDGKRVLVEKVIRSNVYDEDGNQIGTTEEQVDLEEN